MLQQGATRTKSCSLLSFFVALSVASFSLNWVWEMLQMPAYTEMAGRNWTETIPTCTLATLGDVAVTLIIYGIGALAAGQGRWGTTGQWNVYATASLLGAVSAAGIEWKVALSGYWSYNEHMPVIPLLGVGLWPFLQLTLLVPLSLAVAAWWVRR